MATSGQRSIVLITGLSGSVKFTFATAIRPALLALGYLVNIIDLGWFYIPGYDPLRYDEPSSVAWHGLNHLLTELLHGRRGCAFLYNKRTGDVDSRVFFRPNPITIVTSSMVPKFTQLNAGNVSLWIHLVCKQDRAQASRASRADSTFDIPWAHVYAQYKIHGKPASDDLRLTIDVDQPLAEEEIEAWAHQVAMAHEDHKTNLQLPLEPLEKFTLRSPSTVELSSKSFYQHSPSLTPASSLSSLLEDCSLSEDVCGIGAFPSNITFANNVGALQEICVKRHWPLPSYTTAAGPTPGTFTTTCKLLECSTTGTATNKKRSKNLSAKAMIAIIL